jgi:hypothetical protein
MLTYKSWMLEYVCRRMIRFCRADITKYALYKEYHSVCPLVGIGTLPTPLLPASVFLPREPGGGGGYTRLRVRGWGSPNSDD